MNISVTVNLQSPKWKSYLKPYTRSVRDIIRLAFYECEIAEEKKKKSLSVVLADDDFVKNLNANYRHKNQPTNVLSFPDGSEDENEEIYLGDITLAFETIEKEAIEQKKTFYNHTAHLLVHGFLHLLGYDHIKEHEAEKMEAKEIEILAKFSIENPYL